jgi:rubrerythrin
MEATSDFQRQRYIERIAEARATLDRLEAVLEPWRCPMCGHIPYVITATQHCWCDRADEDVETDEKRHEGTTE